MLQKEHALNELQNFLDIYACAYKSALVDLESQSRSLLGHKPQSDRGRGSVYVRSTLPGWAELLAKDYCEPRYISFARAIGRRLRAAACPIIELFAATF
jgi:hypothetical protein